MRRFRAPPLHGPSPDRIVRHLASWREREMVVRELVVVLAAAAACVVELRPCRGVEGQDVTAGGDVRLEWRCRARRQPSEGAGRAYDGNDV